MKSFESNFGNMVPSESSLSCLISVLALALMRDRINTSLNFNINNFHFVKKLYYFFILFYYSYFFSIEYLSGQLDWFCLAFHQRPGATQRPARKIRSSLPAQFGLRPRAGLEGIKLHNSRSRVRWTGFPGLFGLSNICQPTAFSPGDQGCWWGRVGTDNRELVC